MGPAKQNNFNQFILFFNLFYKNALAFFVALHHNRIVCIVGEYSYEKISRTR